jgi:hypothetical protein
MVGEVLDEGGGGEGEDGGGFEGAGEGAGEAEVDEGSDGAGPGVVEGLRAEGGRGVFVVGGGGVKDKGLIGGKALVVAAFDSGDDLWVGERVGGWGVRGVGEG